MPRLPDLDSLGRVAIPQSRRAITTNPAAGAIGEAVSGLGQTAAGIGQGMAEKQDKFAYATARASYLQADIKARAALENDPNYTTYGARYTEQMKAAQAAAIGMIHNGSDRTLFEQDIGTDFARGQAEVQRAATGKQVFADKATLYSGLKGLHETARGATDQASRAAAIKGASDLIEGAKERGTIDPLAAVTLREGWASDYAAEQATMALNREDPAGAQAVLDQFGDKMDFKVRLGIEERVKGVLNVREASDGIDAIMGGATKTGEAPVNYASPLRGRETGVSSPYGAPRPNAATHNGVDMTAKVGTPVFSIGAGVVKQVGHDDRSGNFIVVDHGNGRTSSYSHLGNQSVKAGDLITPDTQLGAVGMTGHTTGPHLHLVVKENGKTVDPTKVIGAAQQSPQRHDLNQIYAQIDAVADAGNFTQEKRERWKQEADRRVARDEQLAGRQEKEQMRVALDTIDHLGPKFTDPSQIPNFSMLAPDDRMQLERIAKANAAPKEIAANGGTAVMLKVLAARDPEAFKNMDLRSVQPFVTPGEFSSLAVDQATERAKPPAQSSLSNIRSEIDTTIRIYGKDVGLDVKSGDSPEDLAQYGRVTDIMRTYLDRATEGGKRKPTDDEMKAAFDTATMQVIVRGAGWFGADATKYRYDVPKDATGLAVPIPNDVRSRITSSLQRNGLPADDPTIARIYMQNKGKPGFWR